MELEPARVRKYAPRSRTGCATCRQRHVRCDERRPICTNCARLGKECEYTLSVPLSHRRLDQSNAVYATQFVWQVSQERMDPFDSLPLSMDEKTRELLHYFGQVNMRYGGEPENPSKNSLTWSIQSELPAALRATVLVALVHYALNTGTLHHFYPTYLQHKGECIKAVNRLLQDLKPENIAHCMKIVAVLAILERHLGDLNKAALHINGILVVLGRIASPASATQGTEDNALFEHHFILIEYFASAIRAALRVREAQAEDTIEWDFRHNLIYQKLVLETLRYKPYFVAGPEAVAPRIRATVIDGESSLRDLRDLTTLVTEYYRRRAQGGQCSPCDDPIEVDLLAYRLSLQPALAKLYVATLYDTKEEETEEGDEEEPRGEQSSSGRIDEGQQVPHAPPMTASWHSFLASYGFYFCVLVGGSRPEAIYGSNAVWHMVTALRRELTRSEPDMEEGAVNRDLWLWMVFSPACVLAKAQDKPRADREYCTDDFRRARQWFESRIRLWSRVTGVTDWYGAKQALHCVLWPEGLPGADFVELVWTSALKEGRMATAIETPITLAVGRGRP